MLKNRLLLAASLVLLPACATKGDWPTLAQRPGEESGAKSLDLPPPDTAGAEQASGVEVALREPAAGSGASADAAGSPPSPAAGAAAIVAAAKLSELRSDIESVDERWKRQKAAVDTASAKVGGRTEGSAWADAQLELSRLDRIGEQISDLRVRLDRVAGDLALASAQGQTVAPALAAAGRAIERVEALRTRHADAFAATSRSLAPGRG